MRKLEEAILWKYIDGECSPEEAHLVETMLQRDHQLADSYALLVQLHRRMHYLESEQPSQNFSQNLLDQLPDFLQRIEFKPLVQPVFFNLLAIVLTLGTLLTGIRLRFNQPPNWPNPLTEPSIISYLVVLLFSLVIIWLFDKWLYRIFR